MLIFLLGSAAVALAFVPVLISSSKEPQKLSKNARSITQPIHAFGISVMTALCLYFVIKKQQWKTSGKIYFVERSSRQDYRNRTGINRYGTYRGNRADDEDRVICSNSNPEAGGEHKREIPFVQVVAFGVGAALWLIANIIYIICFEDYGIYWSWVTLLDVSIYLISVVIQIIFLGQYEGAILPNESLFHYSIALMVADKVWVWLTVTLGDLSQILSRGNTTVNNTSESPFYKTIEISLLFFEPFFLEFLTVSMGVFFHLWNIIGQNHVAKGHLCNSEVKTSRGLRHEDYGRMIASSEESEEEQYYSGGDVSESEQANLLGTEKLNITKRLRISERLQTGMFTVFVIMVHVVLFIVGLFVYQLEPFLPWTNSLPTETLYMLNYGIEITSLVPITIACVVATYKTYKSNDCWSLTFTMSDYLLFFTASANFVWSILRVISATTVLSVNKGHNSNEAVIVLFYALLSIIQVWAQTQMLLAAKSARRDDRPTPKLRRFCLIYIVVINISRWLSIAISREVLGHVTDFHTIMNDCFGDQTTTALTFLFYPAIELYRFHSAVVAYQLLK